MKVIHFLCFIMAMIIVINMNNKLSIILIETWLQLYAFIKNVRKSTKVSVLKCQFFLFFVWFARIFYFSFHCMLGLIYLFFFLPKQLVLLLRSLEQAWQLWKERFWLWWRIPVASEERSFGIFLPLILSCGWNLITSESIAVAGYQMLSILLTCPIPKDSSFCLCSVIFHHHRAWVTTLIFILHEVCCGRIWAIIFFLHWASIVTLQ